MPASIATLRPRCSADAPDNLLAPRCLDVCEEPWPIAVPDAVFTANTLHIMAMSSVQALFRGLERQAPDGARLVVYGPFSYDRQHTSASNARFDESLRARASHSGIRDVEAIDRLARAAGFVQQADHAMPANNRLLVWQREGQSG